MSKAPPLQASVDPAKSATASEILSVLSVEHQVDVTAQQPGEVVAVEKDDGSSVRAGDTLARLDDRTLQMQLVKAKDDLQVAQNNVKYKEAEKKAKEAALRRQQQLRQYGLSSEADLEAAEFEAKGAEYDLHGWEALAESSQAEIRRLELEIDKARIRAPFPGVVVQRYIRQGQTVAKDDKCFRVSQLGPLQALFQVPESSSSRPERGTQVEISLVGDSNRTFAARIIKVSPTVDPASDSYSVTAQLTATANSGLRPGMSVRIHWPGSIPAAKP